MITKVKTVAGGPDQLAVVFPNGIRLQEIEGMHNAIREMLKMIMGSDKIVDMDPEVACYAMELMQYLSPSHYDTMDLSHFTD